MNSNRSCAVSKRFAVLPIFRIAASCCLALFGSAASAQVTTYAFDAISYPGAAGTQLLGLNSRGDFVSAVQFDNGDELGFVAIRQADGALVWTQLPSLDLGGPPPFAWGITDVGTIVGSGNLANGTGVGFIMNPPYTTYTAYVSHPLLNSLPTVTALYAIDAAGVMTGEAYNLDSNGLPIGGVGFIYDPAHICSQADFTDISVPNTAHVVVHGINTACQAVGEGYIYPLLSGHGTVAFIRDPTTGVNSYYQFPTTQNQTRARGITDAGQIVGFSIPPVLGNFAPYVGTSTSGFQTVYSTLYDPALVDSFANGINNSGQMSVHTYTYNADGSFNSIQSAIATPTNATSVPTGTGVDVTAGTIGLADVTLTFQSVTGGGALTVTPIVPASSAGTLLSGYELVGTTYAFEIGTTATYTSPIIIAFQLPYLDATTFSQLHVFHNEAGILVDRTATNPAPNPTTQTIYASVSSLSPFVLAKATLRAAVQQPINSDGSSIFNASRGVVPVKFTLTAAGVATCNLPAATISLTRTAGSVLGSIDENVYLSASDTGSNYRVSGCQYLYNLSTSALGAGSYRVDVLVGGAIVGSAAFALK